MTYEIIFNSFTGIPSLHLTRDHHIHYHYEFIELVEEQSGDRTIYPYTSIACIIQKEN